MLEMKMEKDKIRYAIRSLSRYMVDHYSFHNSDKTKLDTRRFREIVLM